MSSTIPSPSCVVQLRATFQHVLYKFHILCCRNKYVRRRININTHSVLYLEQSFFCITIIQNKIHSSTGTYSLHSVNNL